MFSLDFLLSLVFPFPYAAYDLPQEFLPVQLHVASLNCCSIKV